MAQIPGVTRRDALWWMMWAGLLGPGQAGAYVLPVSARLRFAARHHRGLRGLTVALATTRAGAPDQGETATWRFSTPSQFTAQVGDRRATAGAEGPGAGDAALLPPAAARQVLADLFEAGDPQRVIRRLGVNPRLGRLALQGDRVVHVIGDGAALWIDHDTHAVRRVVAPALGLDLALLDWDSPHTQGRFPGRIELSVSGGPRWQYTVRQPLATR